MPATTPLKTAVFFMRMTPEEKTRWEAKCADRHISLAEALREGARLYFEELLPDEVERVT